MHVILKHASASRPDADPIGYSDYFVMALLPDDMWMTNIKPFITVSVMATQLSTNLTACSQAFMG